jgi:hypothetical protein
MEEQEKYLPQKSDSGDVFFSVAKFEHAQRVAKALQAADMVPERFRGNTGNVLIVIDLAARMGNISPFMLMKSISFIHGETTLDGKLVIALVNGCGRFSPLRYDISGKGDTLACTAVATELSTGEELRGPEVTMVMAKREGWATKAGSKWITMPDLMIRYRSAAFWGRLYIPELLVGIQTQEEALDVESVTVQAEPELPKASLQDLNQKIKKTMPAVIEPQIEEPMDNADEIF